MNNKEAIEILERHSQWIESMDGKKQFGDTYYEVLQQALRKATEALKDE
jgi:hypothetical protein